MNVKINLVGETVSFVYHDKVRLVEVRSVKGNLLHGNEVRRGNDVRIFDTPRSFKLNCIQRYPGEKVSLIRIV
jgi:hypothetical protein